MEKGLCNIEIWEQFKKELKKQFYPVNVMYEARQKLGELRQTTTIREYVHEFTTLILQIPSLSEEDSLFHFMEGLQNWAKQELRRHQVANVDEAIAVTESLVDFKMESAKSKEGNFERGEGDHDKDNGKGIADVYKGNGKGPSYNGQGSKRNGKGSENNSEYVSKRGCYFCKGSHRASECPELGNLATMIGNFTQGHKGDTRETACIGGMRLEPKPKVGDSEAYLGAMQIEHGGGKKS
ncbi:uncharacterized protein [Nicotiana sylvestris]|uniref:uncharacterized protein n=1 Tax=Nicotiana sylvestris TaxID=4096 RepID=UPI00388C7F13